MASRGRRGSGKPARLRPAALRQAQRSGPLRPVVGQFERSGVTSPRIEANLTGGWTLVTVLLSYSHEPTADVTRSTARGIIHRMDVREERQVSHVAEDVSALTAVTRPIIAGLLHSVGDEYLSPHGGRQNIRLGDLGRVRKANDGDLGVAFEYAVHDAIMNGTAVVLDRVSSALKLCRIERGDPASILFAIEKSGAKQLVQTQRELITPESRVLSGSVGQPAKLAKHLNQLAAAFHKPTTRLALP